MSALFDFVASLATTPHDLQKIYASLPPPTSLNQDDARRTDAPTLPFVATNTGD